MTRAIKPHHLLIAALVAAVFSTIHREDAANVVRVAKAQAGRPQATTAAHSVPVAAPLRKASGYDVRGGPSISIARCETVLATYHSPAAGSCAAWYQQSVTANIDLVYLLAFYVHESSAGTAGIATKTKSIGNLRCSGWGGVCIDGFRAYNNYQQAAEDFFQLINGPLYIGMGLTTPEQILPKYAPDLDNNCSSCYAKKVERLVDEWRAAK